MIIENRDNTAPIKFLIVDDEATTLRTITNIIETSGFDSDILQAMNGEIAFEIAKEECPDIILTDWEMPVMNGINLIKALKNCASTSDIPVIMVTGSMITPNDLKLALESGAADYARKPIEKVELIARINSMLVRTSYYNDKLTAEKREQKLLSENLEKAERQLLSSSMHIVNKNNLLIKVKNKIEEMVAFADDKQIQPIQKFIDQSLNIDNDWEQFKQHFDLVHDGFFENLNTICSDLTPYDKKLCAYIRINLSTNEIASILNITADSAKKSKHRLRKKLNLNSEQDIVEYFESL